MLAVLPLPQKLRENHKREHSSYLPGWLCALWACLVMRAGFLLGRHFHEFTRGSCWAPFYRGRCISTLAVHLLFSPQSWGTRQYMQVLFCWGPLGSAGGPVDNVQYDLTGGPWEKFKHPWPWERTVTKVALPFSCPLDFLAEWHTSFQPTCAFFPSPEPGTSFPGVLTAENTFPNSLSWPLESAYNVTSAKMGVGTHSNNFIQKIFLSIFLPNPLFSQNLYSWSRLRGSKAMKQVLLFSP